MSWFERLRGTRSDEDVPRLPQSSPDPVSDALAEADEQGPLVRRMEDCEPLLEELPQWIDVRADAMKDFDTAVVFSDEIHSFTDPAEDGLETALADQPGIEDVFAEDRELVWVRTRLSLADVQAAAVRAVVEVNRTPRPQPAAEGLTEAETMTLVDRVAPALVDAGFVRGGGRWSPLHFHRAGEDGFVQVVSYMPDSGMLSDGTLLAGRLFMIAGVWVPELTRRDRPFPDFMSVSTLDCALTWFEHLQPVEVLETMYSRVLPALQGTRGRAALADWVAGNPERVAIPADRPAYARVFAQWGHHEEARAVLRHLRRKWPSQFRDPAAVEARRILDSAG